MATFPLVIQDSLPRTERWADRFETATTIFLLVCALTAPHSIAASQGSFLLAVVFWLLHSAVTRRWGLFQTPADWPLLIFFGWCLLSSVFSFVPRLSLDGMRSLMFLGAIYVVASRVRNLKWAVGLALALIFSCQINCLYTLVQRMVGVGVRVTDLTPKSPFWRADMQPGDVILKVDGHSLRSLEVLSRMADEGDPTTFIKLQVRRGEDVFETGVRRGAITKAGRKDKHNLNGNNVSPLQGVARLGAKESLSHDFRATGFYSHYATYAEVLQLIASLAIGMWFATARRPGPPEPKDSEEASKYRRLRLLIGLAVLTTIGALLCTVTRAPFVGLGVSVLLMLIVGRRVGRLRTRTAAWLLVLAVSASLAGLSLAYNMRGISATDTHEGSAYWRLVVWQEGIHLVEQHPWFGIGKNSDKVIGRELGLWANGQLPPGHFHNTYLQIAVWWGLPALIAYVWMMWSFGSALWKSSTAKLLDTSDPHYALATGLVLGTLGALAGFATSSVVHFNFGDGEVVMVLWLMLGLSLAVRRFVSCQLSVVSCQLSVASRQSLVDENKRTTDREQRTTDNGRLKKIKEQLTTDN